MSALSPALATEFGKRKFVAAGLIRIELPDHDVRLLDGAGYVEWDGGAFVGRDDTFGALVAISEIEDAMDDEAPALSVTLATKSDAAAATLCSPTMQGSRVRMWLGAVDRTTGQIVSDPYLLFDGELDVPTLSAGQGTREVEYDCVSVFERFFDVDEGFRLSAANHQRVWPGEKGLEHMTGLTKEIYWGVARPAMAGGGSGGGWSRGGGGGRNFANGVALAWS